MNHARINRGFLERPERHALHWLAERTPDWVKPDHLTAVGVAGAFLVMIGFILTRVSPYWVSLVILGLALNWYGDSLDGTLARYRKVERPIFGYFIDHSCDLISQTFIFVGLGLSPYFTLYSALFALSMYLLLSSYTYLKVMTLRKHHLSYGGMGATELRVGLVVWSLCAIWVGADVIGTKIMRYPVLDLVIGTLWVLIFLGFLLMVRSDLLKFRHHDDFAIEFGKFGVEPGLQRHPRPTGRTGKPVIGRAPKQWTMWITLGLFELALLLIPRH